MSVKHEANMSLILKDRGKMKKLKKMFLSIIIFIIISGCNNKDLGIASKTDNREKNEADIQMVPETSDNMQDKSIEESSYIILTESYVENQINLKYPQIQNWEDSVKEKELNELIKRDIIKEGKDILGSNINDNIKPALEIKYEIKMQTKDILSILYTGEGVLEGGHYVWQTVHAITIDLEKIKKLNLTDFVEIDNDLIQKIRESSNMADDFLQESVMDENIIKGLKSSYGNYSFCITPDSLILSIEIPHLAGGGYFVQ